MPSPDDTPEPPMPATDWPEPPTPQEWDQPLPLDDSAEFDAWLDQNQDVKDWVRDGGILRRGDT